MDDRQERAPGKELSLSETLDSLEETEWRFLGEVRHLVDPNDTELLRRLVDLCDQRLRHLGGPRRLRLERIRKRIHVTAELNVYLPVLSARELFERNVTVAEDGLADRRPSKRLNTGSPAPGFEAYHGKLMEWLDSEELSQNSLAQHLEVDPSYLSRAVRGERKNRELFLRLEELTGISAPYMPDEEDGAESGG